MDEQELKAVIEARKELGPEHEQHLIEGFLAKIDKEIDRRVDARVAARGAAAAARSTPATSRFASRSSRSPAGSGTSPG